MTISTVVYPVSDLVAAKAVFSVLAGQPIVDAPYYVGFQMGEMHIGLAPRRDGNDGQTAYWEVEDIATSITELVAAGASISRPASDVGGGLLVAVLIDADGNRIGLRQPTA